MEWSFEARVSEREDKLWTVHVDVPHDIALEIRAAKIQRLIGNFNGVGAKACSLQSKGDGGYYLLTNKELRKAAGFDIGSMVRVSLQEDKSKYGMPMPEEMEELLKQDADADRYFHELSPGKQRSLLFIIGKPKGSETRLKKAVIICEYLKECEGKLDFREMNEAIKENRFKI